MTTATPVSRIAPTPSGYLHLGNALSFILTWLLVRKRGGVLHLRIDDLDAARRREAYIEDIFRTLQRAGSESGDRWKKEVGGGADLLWKKEAGGGFRSAMCCASAAVQRAGSESGDRWGAEQTEKKEAGGGFRSAMCCASAAVQRAGSESGDRRSGATARAYPIDRAEYVVDNPL